MNYLAHIYLAGSSREAVLGSMLGDFVKGDDYLSYPPKVAASIMLHRKIDGYTDVHPVVLQSKHRLSPEHRHTKGVIIDLFYDHFLASDWSNYSAQPLKQFAHEAYQMLLNPQTSLPPRMQRMLPFMVSGDWLSGYRQIEGVDGALKGLSRRLKVPNHLDSAVSDLRRDYGGLKSDFEQFFPQLQTFVEQAKAGEFTPGER